MDNKISNSLLHSYVTHFMELKA